MFNKISIYISKIFLFRFIAVLGFFVIISNFIDLVNFNQIFSSDITTSEIFDFISGRVLKKINFLLNFIFLISLLWTIHRLQSTNELVVLRASGLSSWQIWKSIHLITIIISAIYLFVLNGSGVGIINKSETFKHKLKQEENEPINISFHDDKMLINNKTASEGYIKLTVTKSNIETKEIYGKGSLIFEKPDKTIVRCNLEEIYAFANASYVIIKPIKSTCTSVTIGKTPEILKNITLSSLTFESIKQKLEEEQNRNVLYSGTQLIFIIKNAFKMGLDASTYLLKLVSLIQNTLLFFITTYICLLISQNYTGRAKSGLILITLTIFGIIAIYGLNILINSIFLLIHNGILLPVSTFLTNIIYFTILRKLNN